MGHLALWKGFLDPMLDTSVKEKGAPESSPGRSHWGAVAESRFWVKKWQVGPWGCGVAELLAGI